MAAGAKKKMGITLSLDPKEIAKLKPEEIESRFQKKVVPAILKRMQVAAENDPWHQWSYGFF